VIDVTLAADFSLRGCVGDDSVHIANDQNAGMAMLTLNAQKDYGALWEFLRLTT
jgi:hypothetical protein|tara:strand:+ start:183 stop:344 length:162 start_codon:yes stop_codon:yes gene_type:complete